MKQNSGVHCTLRGMASKLIDMLIILKSKQIFEIDIYQHNL